MQAALSGGTTDLETMNLNLSGAYRLNNAWSFGLGFNAVYARAKIERFAGDLGAVGCWPNYAISCWPNSARASIGSYRQRY